MGRTHETNHGLNPGELALVQGQLMPNHATLYMNDVEVLILFPW